MVSLFVRNLLFTILQPGIVAGLIPFWIVEDKVKQSFSHSLQFYHYAGGLAFLIGLVTMLACIISFGVKGKGTLSPADPTKKLVATGFYKFSRNPMYIGVILILIGEAIFFQSTPLWIYAAFIFLAFNTFIVLVEEPRLTEDFGEEYTSYRKKVRRWI